MGNATTVWGPLAPHNPPRAFLERRPGLHDVVVQQALHRGAGPQHGRLPPRQQLERHRLPLRLRQGKHSPSDPFLFPSHLKGSGRNWPLFLTDHWPDADFLCPPPISKRLRTTFGAVVGICWVVSEGFHPRIW